MFHIDEHDADFIDKFDRLLKHKRDDEADLGAVVGAIINDVRSEGDAAVLQYSQQFDKISGDSLVLDDALVNDAIKRVDPNEAAALELAAARITAYHERQLPKDANFTDDTGARLGWHFSPIRSAGLYVPGGLASYPSSVLMNAIPARVAGVQNIIMCVPTPEDVINPLVLLAARLAGVKRIFRVGGAQAIAAMAYGTKTIPRVDVITGPGNAYVAEAKRQVFGRVGIDMIAGPSEVLVIADRDNDPNWVAIDMLSQAEHDTNAQAILITDDAEFGQAVVTAIEAQLKTLPRADIARASWQDNGAVIIAKTLQSAAHLANRIAPEHLQICTKEARALSHLTTEAGAIFIGDFTPEAIGDYVAGPNHVLPTNGNARFASGLNVMTFMKRTTIQEMTPSALGAIGHAAVTLAKSEGLDAHAQSVQLRLDALNERN